MMCKYTINQNIKNAVCRIKQGSVRKACPSMHADKEQKENSDE